MENQITNTETTSAGQGMGIAALVLGVLGVITAFIPCFGMFAILFGVLATIFGAVGLTQAKKGSGGKGLPLSGLVLGIIATVFTIIWLMLFAGAVGSLFSAGKMMKDAAEETQSKMEQATDGSAQGDAASSEDCDEFLKDYEDFMDRYVEILKKYKSDPTDVSILSDYTTIISEASEWSTKTANCAADPKFAAKFAEIAAKITRESGM